MPASTACRTPMRALVARPDPLRAGPCWRSSSPASAPPIWCRSRIPSTFLPVEDQGYFFVVVQLPDGASLERTDAVAKQVRDVLQATPGVDIVGSIIGPQLPDQRGAVELGRRVRHPEALGRARAGPERLRRSSPRVRPKLLGHPRRLRARPSIRPRSPASAPPAASSSRSRTSPDAAPPRSTRRRRPLIAEARKQPEINPQQLFTSFSTSTPQFDYDLDRNKAKLLGLSLPDVFNTLQIYLGSLYVNDFNLFGRTFRVTLQADKDARGAGDRPLAPLCAQRARAAWCRSRRSGTLRPIVGPETVPHYNNYASALINGAAAPGFSSGQAVAAMERAAADGPAEGFRLRVDGHHLPGAEGGLDRHRRLRARHRLRLPDPGGAV